MRIVHIVELRHHSQQFPERIWYRFFGGERKEVVWSAVERSTGGSGAPDWIRHDNFIHHTLTRCAFVMAFSTDRSLTLYTHSDLVVLSAGVNVLSLSNIMCIMSGCLSV